MTQDEQDARVQYGDEFVDAVNAEASRRRSKTKKEHGKIKLLAIEDRIILKRVEPLQKPGNLVITPELYTEKGQEAEVVHVGPGRVTDAGALLTPEVQVGDRVLVQKYGGTEIKYEGAEYMIVSQGDILCRIEME